MKEEKSQFAGIHFVFDGYFSRNSPLLTEEGVRGFLEELTTNLELEKESGPFVFPFILPEEMTIDYPQIQDISNPVGLSAVMILKTSHISLHTWVEIESSPGSKDSFVSLDIFSCKPFQSKKVLDFFEQKSIYKGNSLLIERSFHDKQEIIS
jgi:hypothetical protein